jgi:hypothetical protein
LAIVPLPETVFTVSYPEFPNCGTLFYRLVRRHMVTTQSTYGMRQMSET